MRIHLGLVLPGLGDHHEQRVGQVPAGEGQELQAVVELGRVARPLDDDGEDLLQVVAEELRAHRALARAHPVDVAAQGVDLAVVGHIAEGLGEVPGRKGIGAIALMDERDLGFHALVGEVRVEGVHLVGHHEALVEHGPGREARNREALVPLGDLVLDDAANHVELAVEGVALHALGTPHEDLPDDGECLASRYADLVRVDGHLAPAEELLALGRHRLLHHLLLPAGFGGILGEEDQPGRVGTDPGQAKARLVGDLAHERVGHLHEDARAVAALGIRAGSAAMGEALENVDPVTDDLVAGPVEIGHEADPAGIVLQQRIVEALFRRQSEVFHRSPDSLLSWLYSVGDGAAREVDPRHRGSV